MDRSDRGPGARARMLALPETAALRHLTADGRRLLLTRVVRLFAYGLLAVVLGLYLAASGLSESQIGLVLTLTLAGDAAVSLWITTRADRVGRRRMLLVGAGLMVLAGVAFASTRDPLLLTLAAIVGVISPSGGDVGPFQAIEQAALPDTVPAAYRTNAFAWYNLVGSIASASGALVGGTLARALQQAGSSPLDSYRVVVIGYAACGVLLALAFRRLSPRVDARVAGPASDAAVGWLGLRRRPGSGSRGPGTGDQEPSGSGPVGRHDLVLRFAALGMVDAFAGGLIVQTLIAYWFYLRFGVDAGLLGAILFGANLLAGLSALVAARLAARIGLLETMVYTHIPSNVLTMLIPLMPTLPLAIIVLFLRYSLSQMDVPTRQSLLVAIVEPDERSAAAGVAALARTLGSAAAPAVSGLLFSASLLGAPFIVAGGLKIVYDLGMLRGFRAHRPPEERARLAR